MRCSQLLKTSIETTATTGVNGNWQSRYTIDVLKVEKDTEMEN